MNLIASWAALSLFFKTFIVFFCFVSIYSLSVSLRVLAIRGARKQAGSDGSLQAFSQFDSLQQRLANLRQIQGFALYLFGLCLSMQVPNAFKTLDSSKSFPFSTILAQLTLLFNCSSVIFCVFILIHTLQWFASVRLQRLTPHGN